MNRVWVLTAGGNVTVLDDKRQLHRVGLYDKTGFIKTRSPITISFFSLFPGMIAIK